MDEKEKIAAKVKAHDEFLADIKKRLSAYASGVYSACAAYDQQHGTDIAKPALQALGDIVTDLVISGAASMTIAMLKQGKVTLAECIEGDSQELARRWVKGPTVH